MESFGFKSILEEAREILDVENRYMFPNVEKIFKSPSSSGKRIVLMANRSGKEGNLKIYEDRINIRPIAGRFVVFEMVDDGRIESGRISEEVLKSMFESEGLNLADFTSEETAKIEFKPYQLPSNIRRPGDPAHLWEPKSNRPDKRAKDSLPSKIAHHDTELKSQWKWISIAGILFVMIFFIVKRVKLAR